MAQTKQANIKELIQDSKNFNRHSEYGMSLLEESKGDKIFERETAF